MKYNVVYGDLFDAPPGVVIGHGVNCHGVMGAGIAKEFRRRFPDMYKQYKLLCDDVGLTMIGGSFLVNTGDRWVANMFTQSAPGPHATIRAIHRSLLSTIVRCGLSALTGLPSQ